MTSELSSRVVIIGAGRVGSTTAFALIMDGLVSEVVLVDRDRDRALGEAADLSHALPFTQATQVRVGDFSDVRDAHVVIMTAGAAQRDGETRLDLAAKNASNFSGIIEQLNAHGLKGVLLVASNPVDVLTHVAHRELNVPASRIIGSGTILDSARFQVELGRHCDIDPRSVHAYIIGEHGDSSVPVWSHATIAGMTLPDFCAAQGIQHSQPEMDAIYDRTRRAAYEIIKSKGATHYAIAAGLSQLVRTIVRDERSILTVSGRFPNAYGLGDDVCLSLPCVLGRDGIEAHLEVPLSADELRLLEQSAEVVRSTITSLKRP